MSDIWEVKGLWGDESIGYYGNYYKEFIACLKDLSGKELDVTLYINKKEKFDEKPVPNDSRGLKQLKLKAGSLILRRVVTVFKLGETPVPPGSEALPAPIPADDVMPGTTVRALPAS